ncbi:Cytochrome P450 monooxygenase 51 [Mycena sanguinolenta]|uniref:Cytochrome P450 monooxygenase 51 n=1 Tax=Mycena sanguinolenta TaxID=230812 RepID=A0A8H6XZQ0_9AGAR|nr:Cytochrome P450 monooxygenase 51 [Mycena sanguinolenta]
MDSSSDRLSPGTITAAVVAGLVILQAIRKFFSPRDPLDAIPSFGIPSYPFGFYVGSWNYVKNGRAITEEGYLKYPGKAFKVALANRWLVLLNGRTLIDDLRKADDSLSVAEAANSTLQLEHTMGHEQHDDPYQVAVIRSAMTRNIGACFPVIRSEVVAAFEDLVPAKDGNLDIPNPILLWLTSLVDWISVPAMQTILPIVSRVSNRFFIGLKCRDLDYIKITTQYALDVISNSLWLHLMPSILRPTAMYLFGHLEPATRATMKLLGPLLQYRIDMDDQYGPDWPEGDRPNDMISWLLDEARGYPNRRTVRAMTRTLLNINFGAIHTTTQGTLHALYNLAGNLQYVEPLREEVESVVRTEGWTKAAMGKLVKLDSFLKESARIVPGGAVALTRQVTKDFMFSDGTMVPAGTLIGVPILAEHHDEANYENADVFDPFRFSRMREKAGERIKHQMVTPTLDYLSFGIGRHAWWAE